MDVQEEILDVQKVLRQHVKTPEKSSLVDLDLGNLIAFDYQEYPPNSDIKIITQNAVQELFQELFNLPIKADDSDPLALLPQGTYSMPREKSVPVTLPPTKWEKFAATKGIQKKKKSRLVFDEISKEYKPRFGRNRALTVDDDWVQEDKPGLLQKYGVEDPFELTKELKREKDKKIKGQQESNIRRRDDPKGLRNKKNINIELHTNTNIDPHVLQRAVSIAQKSTASMGKFDQRVAGEKKLKRKLELVPSSSEERLKAETRIAHRVFKDKEEGIKIDANKAGNQLQQKRREENRKKKMRTMKDESDF